VSKDESLEDSASLPEPDIIIVDIIEDLRTALEQLEEIAGDVSGADKRGFLRRSSVQHWDARDGTTGYLPHTSLVSSPRVYGHSILSS